jgi:hypothetical protein
MAQTTDIDDLSVRSLLIEARQWAQQQRARADRVHNQLAATRRTGIAVGVIMAEFHLDARRADGVLAVLAEGLGVSVEDAAEQIITGPRAAVA